MNFIPRKHIHTAVRTTHEDFPLHPKQTENTNLVLTQSNRCSENSNLNLKVCVALCNAFWKSYAKSEENLFFHCFFYCNFSSNSNFTLKFCLVLSKAIEKFQAKNEENLSMKFRCMHTFLAYSPRYLWDA